MSVESDKLDKLADTLKAHAAFLAGLAEGVGEAHPDRPELAAEIYTAASATMRAAVACLDRSVKLSLAELGELLAKGEPPAST